MLKSIYIKNIILIDKLEIDLEPGLCVLSGETGAGKSILLGALGFVLGERASSSLLRHGEDQGSSTAIFDIANNDAIKKILDEQAIDYQDELILRRIIFKDGKTKAFINDSPVSVGILSEISKYLVEVHGQHQQRGLLDQSTHMDILDLYGRYNTEADAVRQSYLAMRDVAKQLKSLEEIRQRASQEEDYLRFVARELESLDPKFGEEEELSEKRNLLNSSEKIKEAVASAYQYVGQTGIENNLRSAQNALRSNSRVAENLKELIETIGRAIIEVNEADAELSRLNNADLASTDELEAVEERLFALRGAARKYNKMVDDLADYALDIKQKLALIDNDDAEFVRLNNEYKKLQQEYLSKSKILSISRASAASKLQQLVESELKPLKMENAKFEVVLERLDENNYSAKGFDKVSFLASTNPGQPSSPIIKIASGGELSRFMLALKVVLSEVKSVPTMIFDEVDTGIGGATADAVGKRLKVLGDKSQVLVITHQPQVAAKASLNLKVFKDQSSDSTTTNVVRLSQADKIDEIARMLSGSTLTEEAKNAAKQLISA